MANTDTQMQERQKTVVAFIAGLLVGGLLVWVFAQTGDDEPLTSVEGTDTTNIGEPNDNVTLPSDGDTDNGGDDRDDDTDDNDDTAPSSGASGDGSISVSDQDAGTTVTLGTLSYPSTDGWVVVRDFANGEGGRILGAARYSTSVGLLPTSVKLLRSTEAGSEYEVIFYTENGDRTFSSASDTEVSGTGEVFTAQ